MTVDLRFFSGKSILITGSSGPFGRSVLFCLQHACSALTVCLVGRRNWLPQDWQKTFSNLSITFHALDLYSASIAEVLDLPPCDYVLHMASVTAEESFHNINPLYKYELLNHGAMLICRYCTHYRTKKVLFTSSGAVYGLPLSDTHLSEEDPSIIPNTDASSSALILGKLSSEFRFKHLFASEDIPVVIARCFSFSGPFIPPDLHYAFGSFCRSALIGEPLVIYSDGLSVRSYMDLSDLAIWLLMLLAIETKHIVYNVGSPIPITISDLAAMIVKISSSSSDIQILGGSGKRLSNPNLRSYLPNVSRANKLGLFCQISLSDSIVNYMNWLQACN